MDILKIALASLAKGALTAELSIVALEHSELYLKLVRVFRQGHKV